MEIQKRLSRSEKKYIRLQKALIRKGSFDLKKQGELILNLYKKYSPDIINKEAGEKAAAVGKVSPNAAKSPKPKEAIKQKKNEPFTLKKVKGNKVK